MKRTALALVLSLVGCLTALRRELIAEWPSPTAEYTIGGLVVARDEVPRR
jgi:hypothetical protein